MKIPEANLRNMLKAISDGNHVLNERVRFHKNSKIDCPDCSYDPIRKESTNRDCETCDGVGYIETLSYDEIDASIETEEDFNYEFTKAGRLTKGQIFLNVDIKEINEVLNLSQKYNLDEHTQMKSFVNQYDYVTWKGAKYKVDSFEAGWLQGNLYEIGFTMSLMAE